MVSRIRRLLTQLLACLLLTCACVFSAELRINQDNKNNLNAIHDGNKPHIDINADNTHNSPHIQLGESSREDPAHIKIQRDARDTESNELVQSKNIQNHNVQHEVDKLGEAKQRTQRSAPELENMEFQQKQLDGVVQQELLEEGGGYTTHERHKRSIPSDEDEVDSRIMQQELNKVLLDAVPEDKPSKHKRRNLAEADGAPDTLVRDNIISANDNDKVRRSRRDANDAEGQVEDLNRGNDHDKGELDIDAKVVEDVPAARADNRQEVGGGIADALRAAKAEALGENAVIVENEHENGLGVGVVMAKENAQEQDGESGGTEKVVQEEIDVKDVAGVVGAVAEGVDTKVQEDNRDVEGGADGIVIDTDDAKKEAQLLAEQLAVQQKGQQHAQDRKKAKEPSDATAGDGRVDQNDAPEEDDEDSQDNDNSNNDNNSNPDDHGDRDLEEGELEEPGEGQGRYLEPILPEHHALVGLSKHGYTSVDDYGAVPDGVTLNTDAINLAIGAVNAKGGGTVVFPGPGVYLTATIFLMSDVRVLIENGTTVMSTTEPSMWPTIRHRFGVLMCGGQMGRYYQRRFVGGPLFFCHKCNNITMTGKGGVVDGQGGHWWDKKQGKGLYRGYLAMFINSTNIEITDLTFQNSAAWNIVPKYCTNVTIDRVSIYNHYVKGHNTDGVNPYSSKNVNITNTVIVTGDDCIAVKSGPRPSCGIPSENILVNNVTCVGSHGLTIGSEMNAGVQDVVFSNVTIDGRNTPSSQGIRLKSVRGRGGYVRNILYENIRIHNVKIGIQVTLNYRDVDPSVTPVPHFSNITVRNVYGTKIHREIGTFDGLPDAPIDGVYLENVFLFASAGAKGLQCSQTINAKFNRAFPPPDMSGSCVQDRWGMLLEALGWSYGLFSWPRWLSTRMFFWLL